MNTETFQLNFQSVAVIAIVLSVISLIFVGVALIGPFEGQSEKLKQKRLDTKRAFLLTITLLVLATVAVIAFYIGASITSEQKDIIWNVIDSIVSVISAVGTVSAIFAAIWVANRQNKIALFEKRYENYIIIQKLLACALQLEDVNTNKGVQVAFRIYLDAPQNIHKNKSVYEMIVELLQMQSILLSGAFLFSNYNAELAKKIVAVGTELLRKTASHNIKNAEEPLLQDIMELKKEYIDLCETFEKNYFESMENELGLIK